MLTGPGGTVMGLLGPNGAGKATTIKMIAGQIVPTAGRIRLNGHSAQQHPFKIN
jgi:ABC-type multidrug transport system ATPase subunit